MVEVVSFAMRSNSGAYFCLHRVLRHDTITLRFVNECVMRRTIVTATRNSPPMNFKTMSVPDVPQGRNGKHKQIVTKILSDLDQLHTGMALKVPLATLAESKANVRSALNRATRKAKRMVATASDGEFLYIWNEKPGA
jgi:hypothetical protein